MASSLSFVVEVSADQATQALEVVSKAFDQAGVRSQRALEALSRAATRAATQAIEATRRQAESIEAIEDKYAAIRQANGDEYLAQRILSLNKTYARELALVDHNSQARIDIENQYRRQMLAIEQEVAAARIQAMMGPAAPAARAAAQQISGTAVSLAKLKEGANRGRESVMFMTSALGEMGAGGRAAQQAISGAAGALMVGGAAGAMLAAVEGVRLLVNVWQEVAGAEAEAKKRGDAYIKTISEGIPKAIERIKGLKTELSLSLAGDDKVAAFDVKADAERAKLNAALRAAEKAAAQGPDMSQLGEGQFAKARAKLAASVLAARSELKAFEAKSAADRIRVAAEVAEAERKAREEAYKTDRALMGDYLGDVEARTLALAKKLSELVGRTNPAQSAAEKLYGIKGAGLPGTAFPEVGFAGAADVAPLADSQRADYGRAQLKAIDEQSAKALEASQSLTQQIAASWIDALAQMVETTDLSAKSMVKIFAQLASQMMQQSGFAMGGPIGSLIGAFAGRFLPSAAGGWWEVPGDTLAQIHEREMVLPPAEADAVRSMARGGAGSQPTMPVTIVAMDGPSLKDFLVRNGTDFNAAVRELARQGR